MTPNTEILSDEQIIAIRDEHLPSQGEPFDCIAFARAIISAVSRSEPEEWVAQVVSSGEYDFPLLEWRSADVSLDTPIGTKLYASPLPQEDAAGSGSGGVKGLRLLTDEERHSVYAAAKPGYCTADLLQIKFCEVNGLDLSPSSPPNGKTADGVGAIPVCSHGIHMDNACGACVPPRGTTVSAVDASRGGEHGNLA